MSTSLATLRQLLCADISDVIWGSCASTTTSGGSTTTLVDSALIPMPPDFFRTGAGGELPTWIKVTGGSYTGTRAFSAFTQSSGTVTVSSAYSGTIATATAYEIHRMGHPDLKDWCIQQACYDVFPHVYSRLDDMTLRFGDWLIDGHMNYWSSSSALGYWTESGPTLTQTSSKAFGGDYVCAMSTATGYVGQSISNNGKLRHLAGKTVTFYAKVRCGTADSVRLAIYDADDTTYSDYNAGEDGYELLSVTATIADHPSDVAFRVYYAKTTSTAYVTDCYVVGPDKFEYEVGYLDLPNNVPNLIYAMSDQDGNAEFANPYSYGTRIETWRPMGDTIQFTQDIGKGTRLRFFGEKYITQPDSSTSTEPNAPRTSIISALAAKRLFERLAQQSPTNSRAYYAEQVGYWEQEAKKRTVTFGRTVVPITRYRGV